MVPLTVQYAAQSNASISSSSPPSAPLAVDAEAWNIILLVVVAVASTIVNDIPYTGAVPKSRATTVVDPEAAAPEYPEKPEVPTPE
jgi:hypothetical protein